MTADMDSQTAEMLELRSRIEAFELDDGEAMFPFTSRLTREQGWSHAFAARVIGEYKRFLCLAMMAGHPVTPPDAVDQVWHLHLVYTKSYWHRLCREVLGRELHHEPTHGGAEEGGKFADWYEKTLDSYQQVFGEPAPSAIWPEPALRFAHSPSLRWVDCSLFWLIPRPFRFLGKNRRPPSISES